MRAIQINPKDRPLSVDPGPAPMLQWLRIDALVVDDSYQRELRPANWTAIRKIAARFKWSRFSPVFVAPVEGGKFAIIDGQHRTHAASMCGFAEVPCQIVQMSREEQAASFAAVNGLVTKVSNGQITKAALAAGEQWAIDCHKCVEDAGAKLMLQNNTTNLKQPGEVYALALVKRLVAAGKGGLVTAALQGLKGAECGKIADYWTGPVLKVLLTGVTDRPYINNRPIRLSAFLDEFDVWDALEQAQETAKKKRRMGFANVTQFDLALASFGEALDEFARKAAA